MIFLLLYWLEVLCSKLTVFQYQSLVEQVGQNPEQIRFRLDAFGIDLVGEQDKPTSTPRRGHRPRDLLQIDAMRTSRATYSAHGSPFVCGFSG